PSGHPRTRRHPRPATRHGTTARDRHQAGPHAHHTLVHRPARRRDHRRRPRRAGTDPRAGDPGRSLVPQPAPRSAVLGASMTDDAPSPVIALDDAPPPASAEAADGSASDADTKEVPEPVYTAVEDWVTGYFLPMFRRTLGGEFRWCAQWWRHSEAISRLGAL